MSTIYMNSMVIQFQGFQPAINDNAVTTLINTMVSQGNFNFPSNVIGCGLFLTQSTFTTYSLNSGTGNTMCGPTKFFGLGIDNINFNGTSVTFTAWMKFQGIYNDGNGGGDRIYTLNPNYSNFTVQAIAECE